MHAKSLQSCLTLWVPMDCSPPGSSVHGILQARILEWVAMSSFRWCPLPRDGTVSRALWADSLLLNHCRSPFPPRGPGKQQGRGGLLQERELPVNSPTPHAHNVVCLQTCWFCFQSLSWVALSSPLQVICQVQAPRCPVQSACPARRQLQGPLWTRTRQSPSRGLRDGGQALTRDDSPSHPHHSSPMTYTLRLPVGQDITSSVVVARLVLSLWLLHPSPAPPVPQTSPSGWGPWGLWSRLKKRKEEDESENTIWINTPCASGPHTVKLEREQKYPVSISTEFTCSSGQGRLGTLVMMCL